MNGNGRPARPRHLISIEDLDRAGDRADPGPGGIVRRGLGARDQEGAGAARPHGRQPLLRGLDPHELELRARGQASVRRRGVGPRAGLGGRQGRVAQGHRADALGLRPGRPGHPLAAGRRRPARRGLDRGGGDQRRRRQARAPDPGAARRVHAAPPARRARRAAASGSWATCSTRGSPARTSWPSIAWAPRSPSAARRR